MKNNEILQKTFEYNKAGFEHIYNAVSQLQEQAEELTGKTLEKAEFIPEEGKVFVQRLFELGKKAGESYKHAVTKGQQQIEGYIAAL